jgi:hypothetical protein
VYFIKNGNIISMLKKYTASKSIVYLNGYRNTLVLLSIFKLKKKCIGSPECFIEWNVLKWTCVFFSSRFLDFLVKSLNFSNLSVCRLWLIFEGSTGENKLLNAYVFLPTSAHFQEFLKSCMYFKNQGYLLNGNIFENFLKKCFGNFLPMPNEIENC